MTEPQLLMSMPDYYATLSAIAADPSCAPYLADKFEEAGMDWHADYFRTGYAAARQTDELCGIIVYYGVPDMNNRNERFTAALCYALVRGSSIYNRVPTFDYDVVTKPNATTVDKLADYNLVPVIIRTKPHYERSKSNPGQQAITFE